VPLTNALAVPRCKWPTYAYVLENGQVHMHGPARELADDPRVVEAYLGLGSKHQAMLSS